MKTNAKSILLLGAVLIGVATTAQAHRQWLLSSTTVLSGEGQWISVEGAISNDLFFPNHVAIPLEATTATAPSGKQLELKSPAQGKIHSTFELLLEEQGTYRITTLNNMMFASWKENGEPKRMRGNAEKFASMDLASMEDLQLGKFFTRVETIVTCGEPTTLATFGEGIEFEFITHPNDLYHGETATFRVLLDGQPMPEAEVTIVKGNDRFRDSVDELIVTSNAKGLISVEWPSAGRFWLNISSRKGGGEFKGYPLRGGTSYSLTLEVLPE